MRVFKSNYFSPALIVRKTMPSPLLVVLAFALLFCGGPRGVQAPTSIPQNSPGPVTTSRSATVATTTQTDTPTPPAHAANSQPTNTPVPVPIDTPTPVATIAPLFYNLPLATLTLATGLYASPNRSELIVPATIPAGETVYVMGRNGNGSHLRVVWSTGVGWVPVSFTDYNGRQDRLKPLPVFTREPPACAVPITTQFGLNSSWTSETKQRIAVIVDLFRSRYGDFPPSSLLLIVNGVEVEESRRQIVERGQFSLKDVVFTIPQDVQPGDTLGYQLQTSSDESLTFMATIFSVPQNCQWDID